MQTPIDSPDDVRDVVIIGGGPAGSTLAAYLAKAGLRCVVLEREKFPREHVGESLVPGTTRVFKELGFLRKMEEAGFPHKYGAVWTTVNGRSAYDHDWEGLGEEYQVDIRFEEREQEGVDQNYTYHVDRGLYDQLLLQHAQELGAEVCEEAAVNDVDFSHEDYVTVTYRHGGATKTVRAKMVADASGRRTFLGNKLGFRITDEVFDQYALHTWFEGYDRGTSADPKADYIYIHFLPLTNTWVWQIPITDTITSVGVVTQKKNFVAAKDSHEQFFWDCIGSRPELHEKLRAAKQLRPLKPEGDYSYVMQRFCGDRFVLVGDAARFVDPIFSSGVSIAMNSARLASRDIVQAFEAGDFSEERFRTFETTMKRGCSNWYRFITLYYRLNVLYTYLLRDERYRLDILRLLQGEVYDEGEIPVLRRMEEIVSEVEQNEKHVWHKLLGSLTADAFKSAAMKPAPAKGSVFDRKQAGPSHPVTAPRKGRATPKKS
jgi:FADH2 O2-dependent halogenase